MHIDCVNKFEPLTSSSSFSSGPSGNLCSGEKIDNMHIDVKVTR